jgi:hypothetical protein
MFMLLDRLAWESLCLAQAGQAPRRTEGDSRDLSIQNQLGRHLQESK